MSRPSPDPQIHYIVDDFTDRWYQPQTILVLHGNAESGLAWYAWVPRLARAYRLVRPDMRGFGQSTPMPPDHAWTLDELTADFCGLMDHLAVARFHLVGAKIGGAIARAFAARRPERLITLTVVGTSPPFRVGAAERVPDLSGLAARFRRKVSSGGASSWAAPRYQPRSASWAPSPAPTSRPTGQRSPLRHWSSQSSKACLVWFAKLARGNGKFLIPSWWCWRATHTTSPRPMPIRLHGDNRLHCAAWPKSVRHGSC
jgi:pimeloyl-ACP methyl ester carboxylesterase